MIVAGGAGSRMNSTTKKAFLLLNGEPLVLQTARAFAGLPGLGQCVCVLPESELKAETGQTGAVADISPPPKKAGDLVRGLAAAGVSVVATGGARRQDSVLNGLKATDPRLPYVMIHDAARPFVTVGDLMAVMARTRETGAATLAHSVRDTIKRVEGDTIRATIDRSTLWAAQTPQCFRREALMAAFAKHNAKDVTDDAAMAALDGLACAVVQGSPMNFKITTPEDLELAEALLKARNASAVFRQVTKSETIFDMGPKK